MDILTTATGKKVKCDYFNPFPPADQVNLRVLGMSLLEAVTLFTDTNEINQLHCGEQFLNDHTKVVAIIPEGDAVRFVLGRE